MNWFAAKYGAIVLAAPIRGGFDNVAWIVPAAVFGLACVAATSATANLVVKPFGRRGRPDDVEIDG